MKNEIFKIANFLLNSSYFDDACVLLDVPDNVKMELAEIANSIDKDIINIDEGGVEDTAHITVIYGVDEDVNLSDYFKKPIDIKTDNKITYFDNDKFSVAKIKVFSNELNELHYDIKKNEDNKHKYDYSPHITIAYLNKGERLPIGEIKQFEWQQNDIQLQRNGLLQKVELEQNVL